MFMWIADVLYVGQSIYLCCLRLLPPFFFCCCFLDSLLRLFDAPPGVNFTTLSSAAISFLSLDTNPDLSVELVNCPLSVLMASVAAVAATRVALCAFNLTISESYSSSLASAISYTITPEKTLSTHCHWANGWPSWPNAWPTLPESIHPTPPLGPNTSGS